MNTDQTTLIDLDLMQVALEKLSQREHLFTDLSVGEREQLKLTPQLAGFLKEIDNLRIRDTIGGFINKEKADEKIQTFKLWRESIVRIFPGARELLTALLDFKPLGSSIEHISKLLERSQQGDYMQISLGLTGKELNCMVAILDEHANIRLGRDIVDPTAKVVGDDYVDDMRPCPPCTATSLINKQ